MTLVKLFADTLIFNLIRALVLASELELRRIEES